MANQILIRSHTPLQRKEISGGAARLMKNLAQALSDTGWKVSILSPKSSNDWSENQGSNIKYWEFNYGDPSSSAETIINTVRGISTYRDVVRSTKYDVILDDVSHFPYYPAHFLRPKQTTNAVFMHTAFFGAAKNYLGPLRGSVIDLIDRTLPYLSQPEIICAGPGTKKRIHTNTGYTSTHILNPCVRIDDFEYNFAPESNTILYLGRLGTRKNVSCLLRAWDLIETRCNRDISLVIAGSGPKKDELLTLAADLNLSNVDFVGYVKESEKQRLFKESLLYILPSMMEGYVTTGIEALASGTAVIGSDTFGINDYIEHGKTGYLFPVDDYKQLANQVLGLVDSPEQMRPIAERGRELACEHSFDKFRTQANELFTNIS